MLLAGDVKKDKAARFHWRLLSALWNYAADCLPEIADNAASVDRAMRAGLQLGDGSVPAMGCGRSGCHRRADGVPASPNVERLLAAGGDSWYENHGRECFDLDHAGYQPIPSRRASRRIATFRASQRSSAAESRSVAGGSRRRRGLPGTALQEERHRRGYRPLV